MLTGQSPRLVSFWRKTQNWITHHIGKIMFKYKQTKTSFYHQIPKHTPVSNNQNQNMMHLWFEWAIIETMKQVCHKTKKKPELIRTFNSEEYKLPETVNFEEFLIRHSSLFANWSMDLCCYIQMSYKGTRCDIDSQVE